MTDTGGASLLTLTDVAGARGGRRLFEGIELRLALGAAAIVTGPNGAGKTTLLRIAAGLLRPAAGTVARNGAVAWLGEAAALDEELPLADALAFWERIDRSKNGVASAATALGTVGLGALGGVPVRFLSTGQRRRAALARVIASGAALWLLDEPVSGLDTVAQAALATAIATHRADGGAVLTATHQPLDLPGAVALRLG